MVMAINQKIPWVRIAAEGVAIVVSILLAFWIEAWWSARQDRNDEIVILSSLLEEFRQIESVLERNDIFHNAMRSSAEELLALSIGRENPVSDGDIDRLLADITWQQTPESLSTPELSSLISSGNLALISNAQLRRDIGSLQYHLAQNKAVMLRDLEFYTDRLMPFLEANSLLQQVINADDYVPGFPNRLTTPATELELVATVSHSYLLENREFQSLLSRRILLVTDVLNFPSRGIKETLAETTSLIEQELAR